ncbi:50S ribosomal protein L11 methyltransferase [Desulfobotulus mexicanus]|uniref:Ribosomal protein L11 methyltransferase n=1 Tax=Desulfobotulus mexicanus TaxID=2586642 RepID=A0A5Q4VGZ2_9BACT|nr:50S ribosomal protein L11 methyltransferase [Desulfobotulus mexicanus]TYT75251.1 50S ribosomal protein L11 methyltransferase [Desulfobotulus mexicanus]
MKWIALKIIFEGENPAMMEDLLAAVFANHGINGVSIDQPDLEPEEGWGEDALPKPEFPAVTGYIPKNEEARERMEAIVKEASELALALNFSLRSQSVEIDEEDWAESWKAFFWPEKIGKRIVVKPTWRSYDPKGDDIVLEIDPGMAFGTGTHPTTSLCIQKIEAMIRPGDAVLDVGTGSGILLMAAGTLGAGRLVGVDNDSVAIEVAAANLSLNGFGPEKRDLFVGNLAEQAEGPFDLVVANILAEVVVILIPDIGRVLRPGGRVILSGIIEEKVPMVLDALRINGFSALESELDRGWAVCVASLNSPA